MGRCALHTTRSLAVSNATSAASPVSASSCCIHGWRGRPRGRFHCGLLSGRWQVLALTARCSAIWAGVTSGSRLTWPNIAWRLLVILSWTLSWPEIGLGFEFRCHRKCRAVIELFANICGTRVNYFHHLWSYDLTQYRNVHIIIIIITSITFSQNQLS